MQEKPSKVTHEYSTGRESEIDGFYCLFPFNLSVPGADLGFPPSNDGSQIRDVLANLFSGDSIYFH